MIPIDAYVELGEGCEGTLESLRALGFKLALVRRLPGCGSRPAPPAGLRLLEYPGRAGMRISEFEGGGLSEVLLVRLSGLDVGALEEAMGKRPNVVRVLVVRFSELRELHASGSLNMRTLRALFELALDRHAPLLMGSGARRPEELLGPRALYSPLTAIAGEFWNASDYRRAQSYLYESAVM